MGGHFKQHDQVTKRQNAALGKTSRFGNNDVIITDNPRKKSLTQNVLLKTADLRIVCQYRNKCNIFEKI